MRLAHRTWTCLVLAACFISLSAPAQRRGAVIAEGSTVTLEYTVTLDDGTVVDSSDEGGPLTYVQGDGEMLAALEAALEGMREKERKSIRLAPEDAYGPFDPDAFREVPIDNVPESARRLGAELRAPGGSGTMRVHEIRQDTIVLDLNNPLAGKALTFDVRVRSIK